MATDVWLVARVGLVSGSNGSFGDAWVSLLSLVVHGISHTLGCGSQRLRYVEVCCWSVVLDGWPRTQLYSEWDRNKNEREVLFLRTGGTLADRAMRSRVGRDDATSSSQIEDSGRDPRGEPSL